MSIYKKLLKSMIRENKKHDVEYVKSELLMWSHVENPVNEDTRIKLDVPKEKLLIEISEKLSKLSEKINIDDNTKWGIMINEKMKKTKFKDIVDKFEVDKENKTVSYKDNLKIVLNADAIDKISQYVKTLTTTGTKSISSVFKLDNYNKEKDTININNQTIKVSDLLELEKVLIHYFRGN